MSDELPSTDEVRASWDAKARAASARATALEHRRSEWKARNVRLVGEFLGKASELGVEPPPLVSGGTIRSGIVGVPNYEEAGGFEFPELVHNTRFWLMPEGSIAAPSTLFSWRTRQISVSPHWRRALYDPGDHPGAGWQYAERYELEDLPELGDIKPDSLRRVLEDHLFRRTPPRYWSDC